MSDPQVLSIDMVLVAQAVRLSPTRWWMVPGVGWQNAIELHRELEVDATTSVALVAIAHYKFLGIHRMAKMMAK